MRKSEETKLDGLDDGGKEVSAKPDWEWNIT
jgi:hypothetical protein